MIELAEVAAVVEELLDERAVRWPDGIAPSDEMVAQVMLASPRTARRIRETLRTLIGRAEGLDQLVDELDVLAIRFGQDDDGETAAALLSIGDAIRDWRDRG
jgi:hypothetical protein